MSAESDLASADPAAPRSAGDVAGRARYRTLRPAAGSPAERNQLRRNLRRFLIGNRLNLIGLVIVVLFFLLALFGRGARAVRSRTPRTSPASKLLAPVLRRTRWAPTNSGATSSAGS